MAPKVKSSNTSLASRAHFEVPGLSLEGQVLGLEASCSQKLVLSSSRGLANFRVVKSLWSAWKLFFSGDRLKNFCEDLFFWRALALVSLVLGLEHSCPWSREGLFSIGLSLALAADFFFGLEPYVLDSTSVWHIQAVFCFILWCLVNITSKEYNFKLWNYRNLWKGLQERISNRNLSI